VSEDGRKRRGGAMRTFVVGSVIGAAAALVQALGLVRWPFAVPELARRYIAADGPDAAIFQNAQQLALQRGGGLADLVETMRRVRASLNPGLDIDGVLLTMFDERTNLGQQVASDVRQFFKEKVFHTVIPRNVRLGEAPSHGMPVALYDSKSRGAEAYLALAREVLERSAATAA